MDRKDEILDKSPIINISTDGQEISGNVALNGNDDTPTDTDSGALDDVEVTYDDDVTKCLTSKDIDGGYGWVIVLASFFNAFIIDGVGSCFGLIFPHVVEKFGASAFVTSFAGSLFVSLLIMGCISAALVRRFGYRPVSMAGGILACCAFILGALSPNIVTFILSYGLFAGCSCGLVFLPSFVIVNDYFHERRGLANGIITSGSGAGLLVLAPIVNFLLREYSLEGTILIMAGFLLNMSLFSCLYRPLKSAVESENTKQNAYNKEHQIYTVEDESTDSGNMSNATLSGSVETVDKDDPWIDAPLIGSDKKFSDGECPRYEDVMNVACKQVHADSLCGHSLKQIQDSIVESCPVCVKTHETLQANKCCFVAKNKDNVLNPLIDNNSIEEHENGNTPKMLANDNETSQPLIPIHPTVYVSPSGQTISRGDNNLYLHANSSHPQLYNGRFAEQTWQSAHHLPTQEIHLPSDRLYTSAHDVTLFSTTHTHAADRPKLKTGVSLLGRTAGLLFNKRRRQANECHVHENANGTIRIRSQSVNNDTHRNTDLHQKHFQEHNRLKSYYDSVISGNNLTPHIHRHDTHHSSHSSAINQESNLYLTGSISTIRNLHIKHILYRATSRDSYHFATTDCPVRSRTDISCSSGSRAHLPHVSESHTSGLNHQLKLNSSCRKIIPNTHPTVDIDSKSNIPVFKKSHLPLKESGLVSPYSSSKYLSYSLSNSAINEEVEVHSLTKQTFYTYPGHQENHGPRQLDRAAISSAWSVGETPYLGNSLKFDESKALNDCPTEKIEVFPMSGFTLKQLLHMPSFLLFVLGSCLIQVGYPLAGVYLADLAYHHGLEDKHTAMLMGFLGGMNICGRLLSGVLANMGVSPIRLLYLSLFLGGVACLFAPLYTGFWTLALFAGLFGFFLGFFPPVQPLIIVEYFGLASLSSVFGLLTTLKGAASMLGPPLAGWVYDTTRRYELSFMFGGVVFIISAAVHVTMIWFRPK